MAPTTRPEQPDPSDQSAPAADRLAAAESRLPQMIADIIALIEVETPSADLEAVARGADAVAQLCRARLGQDPEQLTVEGTRHLRLAFGAGPTRVVLLCHQDTVWPTGTLQRIPASVREGILRGPGCFDMLTGLVMAIHAAAMLTESRTKLDGLVLLVTGDEEIGSPTSRALIEETAAGARAVLVLEASAPGGALKSVRKGGGIYSLRVTGKAAHAGLEPERGVSALLELAAQLPAIRALEDPQAGTTVTPTVFSGGTTRNTVPANAQVAIDTRAKTAAELERVDVGLRALTPTLTGAELSLDGGVNRPPLDRASSAGLLAQYLQVSRDLGVQEPADVEVGGCSDGNFTAGIGVPTLDGLGAVGDGAHAEHEHVVVAEVAPRTAVLTELVARLLDTTG